MHVNKTEVNRYETFTCVNKADQIRLLDYTFNYLYFDVFSNVNNADKL